MVKLSLPNIQTVHWDRKTKCPGAKYSVITRQYVLWRPLHWFKLNLRYSATLATWSKNIESETCMTSSAAPACRLFPANTVWNNLLHRTKTSVEISFPPLLPHAWTTKDMILLLYQWKSLQFWAQAIEAYSFLLGDTQFKLNTSTKITQMLSESGINVHFLSTWFIIYLAFFTFYIFLPCSIKSLPPPTLKTSDFQKCMKTKSIKYICPRFLLGMAIKAHWKSNKISIREMFGEQELFFLWDILKRNCSCLGIWPAALNQHLNNSAFQQN